jgi:hypothetical protein
MVQRKQARKKPEDLVVLADADSRAGQAPPPRAGRTALAPLPNYMRPTTCSGARGGRASPPHATCSSTMKGPPAHACSFAYCSLKGSFLASRRRRSMKLEGASPFRNPVNDGGYIVEIRAKGSGDGSCGSGVVVSDGSLRSSTPSDNRGRRDDGTRVLLDRDDSGAACESDISDDLGAERQGNIPQGEISDDACLFH